MRHLKTQRHLDAAQTRDRDRARAITMQCRRCFHVLICQALLSCLLALAFRLDIFSVIKGIVGTYVDICKITSIVRCVHTLLSLFHSCGQGWDMFTDSMSQLLDSALACEIKSGSGMVCVSRLHAVTSVCCLIPCIRRTRTH